MGYLSCKAQSSVVTCRSLSSSDAADPSSTSRPPASSTSAAAGTPRTGSTATGGGGGKAKGTAGTANGHANGRPQEPRRVRVFSYSELEAATSNFSDQALLGRGSHGSVYRAVLRPSGRPVAVKRPSRIHHHHHQHGGGSSGRFALLERNEVENEIDILSRIHNPRLVNLVGVSTYDDGTAAAADGRASVEQVPSASASASPAIRSSSSSSFRRRERLLVVEYMPNGTLYDLLHSNPHPPSWSRRLRLALHTAKAIHALHSSDPPIIHRDVKAANVLIDANFNARLGDFGLALRAANGDGNGNGGLSSSSFSSASIRSTPPAGTLGYLDPGYITPENLSTKTDVFSFGILLLELMSGRKAIDVAHSPPSVVEWAFPLLRKGKVLALYDPRIAPPKDPATRRRLACLAASCVRSCKEKRPSMEEVVVCLKLICKILPYKSWATGLSVRNPCLMVEAVERPHNVKPNDIEECSVLSPAASYVNPIDEFEETAGEQASTSNKKSPSSSKAVHPLRNARRVFSERDPRSGSSCGRNLMDLMMAPDEETLKVIGRCHQRSIISRARTPHLSRDNVEIERDCMLHFRRNQSMRGDSDILSRLDAVRDLDGKASIH